MKERLFIGGILLFCVMILSGNLLNAQILGTATNYSGSRGLAVNPSLMTTSFVYADFGLNLNVSAYNDFAYLNSSDYLNLFKGGSMSDYYVNGKKYQIGFVMNEKPKNVYETLDFNVISMMFNPKGKRAYGFFVNARVYTDGKRIPWEIPEAGLVSIEGGDYLNRRYISEKAKIGLMAWSEIGFSYSMTVYDRYNDKIDVGATLKGLLGYVGVALNLNEVDKTIYDKNSSVIHKLDMVAAMAVPIDYGANFVDGQVFSMNQPVKGLGIGADLGFTYTNKKESREHHAVERPCTFPKIPYNWRIGVSLLDLGAIRFNKNAKVYSYLSDKDRVFDVSKLEGVKSFEGMMDSLGLMFYENPNQALKGEAFMMGLPTALSLQFDFNIWESFYVNSTWVQPLSFMRFQSARPAQLTVNPRYESTFFDFSVPVTFYNYEKLLLGIEARLAFLTIGTQNVLNLLGIGKSYGMDLYVALKFNLYKGRCFGGSRGACWNAGFR